METIDLRLGQNVRFCCIGIFNLMQVKSTRLVIFPTWTCRSILWSSDGHFLDFWCRLPTLNYLSLEILVRPSWNIIYLLSSSISDLPDHLNLRADLYRFRHSDDRHLHSHSGLIFWRSKIKYSSLIVRDTTSPRRVNCRDCLQSIVRLSTRTLERRFRFKLLEGWIRKSRNSCRTMKFQGVSTIRAFGWSEKFILSSRSKVSSIDFFLSDS